MANQLLQKIAALEDELADYKNAVKMALCEKCTANEVHCACVPPLRTFIKQLTEELDTLHTTLTTKRAYNDDMALIESAIDTIEGLLARLKEHN